MSIFSKITGLVLSSTSTPAAGRRYLYAKSDGWYDKNSAGVESKLTSAGNDPNVYSAVLTGSNGAIAAPTVLKNDLSAAIVWAYGSEGVYTGTLASAFTADKTAFAVTVGSATGGVIPKIVRTSADVVTLSTFAVDGTTAADFIGTLNVTITVFV